MALEAGKGGAGQDIGSGLVAKKQKPRSSAKKRPAKEKAVTATRRSTAGTGFDFEDHVAGWFLLEALAGRSLTVEGAVQRLQMQTGSLRWDIDDLLVTTQAKQRLGACNLCKGNVQVSANGLPRIVRRAGVAALDQGRQPVQSRDGSLALATQGTHEEFQSAWSDIRNSQP